MRTQPAQRQPRIYLDYHATTPTDPRVAAVIEDCLLRAFGNPSSTDHDFGDEADALVRDAQREVGHLVGANPKRIIFTSGATESVNLAIQGFVRQARRESHCRPIRIGCMPLEHPAVLETCHALVASGEVQAVDLSVDRYGQLDLAAFERCCSADLDLVCVMAANNEIGTVYPIAEACRIAKRNGVVFLTDATQAVGRIPIQVEAWGIDFLALSAHKIYGPKGVGALVVSPDHRISPLVYGGGHQGGLRPGTLNVPGIVGLGEACRLRALEMATDEDAIGRRRERLLTLLRARVPDLVVNGHPTDRLSGNLHISVPGTPNSAVVARLRTKVAISTGAACSSGAEAPSHVLRAIGLPEDLVEGALRIGLGKFVMDDQVAPAAEEIASAIEAVRVAVKA